MVIKPISDSSADLAFWRRFLRPEFQFSRRQTIQFAQEKYAHLFGLTLDDSCSGNEDSPIDILVGLDQYCNIVTGRIILGETNEPVAASTHLD